MAIANGPQHSLLLFAAVLQSFLVECIAEAPKHAPHKKSEEAIEYETLYLLFAFLVLGAGVLHLTTFRYLHRLPVTVIFFAVGIVFSLYAESGKIDGIQELYHSYTAWESIDPHLLLFTFLPPLLFSDAFAVDTYVAKRTSMQCLLLAGPGVVIGSFATAYMFYYWLPYGFSFATSMMIGSILSATDPVAVVSLLKDLGASPVLTMQIQGESMLNDGTAMVLFTVAYGVVGGAECGISCITSFLLKATFGAWFMGMGVAFFFVWWIRGASNKFSHRSSLIQMLLTIACAYWAYLLADGICHMSGVLATVSAALVCAQYMWPSVVERQAMLEFWHVVETIGNTLVFFLAGMLTGQAIPHHEFRDFLWVLIIWAALTVIRLGTLVVLLPFLNRLGAKVTWQDVIVMTWGGLRGMVGLALAILVREHRADGALDEMDANRVLFIVGGVAALTLVVNATTAPMVCAALGVTKTDEVQQTLVRTIVKRAQSHVDSSLKHMVSSGQLPDGCMIAPLCETVEKMHEAVNRHMGAEKEGLETTVQSPNKDNTQPLNAELLWKEYFLHKGRMLDTHTRIVQFKFGDKLKHFQELLATSTLSHKRLKAVRQLFLEVVRASYWEQMHHGPGILNNSEQGLLLASLSLAKDQCDQGLMDWAVLERDIDFSDVHKPQAGSLLPTFSSKKTSQRQLPVLSWVQKLCSKTQSYRQMRAARIVEIFVKAQQHAQAEIATFFGLDSPEEVYVILESQIQIFRAVSLQGKVDEPVRQAAFTSSIAHQLCEEYRHVVVSAHEQGVLQDKETEMLLEPVGEVIHELTRRYKGSHTAVEEFASSTASFSQMYQDDAAISIQRAYRCYRAVQANHLQGVDTVKIRSMRSLTAAANTFPTMLAQIRARHEDAKGRFHSESA